MNEEPRDIRQDDLAFVGRIGASITHDMRNVLSVIGEYAGLLEDLVAPAKWGKSPDKASLKKLSAGMVNQVKKGTEIMERFSRFAHSTDHETTAFDLAAVTENMTALTKRRASNAGCRLESESPSGAIPVTANPLRVQLAMYSGIGLILQRAQRDAQITIRPWINGSSAVISITAATEAGVDLSAGISEVSAVVADLNGTIETTREGDLISLNIIFPTV